MATGGCFFRPAVRTTTSPYSLFLSMALYEQGSPAAAGKAWAGSPGRCLRSTAPRCERKPSRSADLGRPFCRRRIRAYAGLAVAAGCRAGRRGSLLGVPGGPGYASFRCGPSWGLVGRRIGTISSSRPSAVITRLKASTLRRRRAWRKLQMWVGAIFVFSASSLLVMLPRWIARSKRMRVCSWVCLRFKAASDRDRWQSAGWNERDRRKRRRPRPCPSAVERFRSICGALRSPRRVDFSGVLRLGL